MSGTQGPAARRRRNKPINEWREAEGAGWQHGKVPPPPPGLCPEAVEAWQTWMASWVASFWKPGDLPGLFVVAKLYDRATRNPTAAAVTALRQWMTAYGLTPAGQQARRWRRPAEDAKPAAKTRPASTYKHLKVMEPHT